MKFPTTTLYAQYNVTTPFVLPHHSGSTLRGVMRRALLQSGCEASRHCEGTCARGANCAVGKLLGPGKAAKPAAARLQALYPLFPHPRRRVLKQGDTLKVGVRIFGEADASIMATAQGMFERFEGFELAAERGRVRLCEVVQAGRRNVRHDCAPAFLEGKADDGRSREALVALCLETPCWVEKGGRLLNDHTFANWFGAIHWRLTGLAKAFGHYDEADQARYAQLRERAGEVETTGVHIERRHWTRRPQSGAAHPMHGLTGRLAFRGALGPFLPYLQLAELTGVGKATSFGLGRFRVEAGGSGGGGLKRSHGASHPTTHPV